MAIRTELLQALRGKRSQRQLSQKLGFSYSKVSRWESGKNEISWLEFLKLCEAVHCPIRKALKTVFAYHEAPDNVPALIRHFAIDQQNPRSQEIKISKRLRTRWLNGESVPDLLHVLQLMYFGSIEFFPFFRALGTIEKMNSLSLKDRELERERQLHFQIPWVPALLCALDSKPYKSLPRHNDQWVADKARAPVTHIKEALKRACFLV